jgi:hypothetical protein
MLALGIANRIRGLSTVRQFRAVGFPGLVPELAQRLKGERQASLALGKRGRMHAQVLGQFGITPALWQNPQVERKQMNPPANLEIASSLLFPGRRHQQLKDSLRGDARPPLRLSRLLAPVCPLAVWASLAPERVGLYRGDQRAGKTPVGIPGNAGERQPIWLAAASSLSFRSRSSSGHRF